MEVKFVLFPCLASFPGKTVHISFTNLCYSKLSHAYLPNLLATLESRNCVWYIYILFSVPGVQQALKLFIYRIKLALPYVTCHTHVSSCLSPTTACPLPHNSKFLRGKDYVLFNSFSPVVPKQHYLVTGQPSGMSRWRKHGICDSKRTMRRHTAPVDPYVCFKGLPSFPIPPIMFLASSQGTKLR